MTSKQQVVQVVESSSPIAVSPVAIQQERHMKLMEYALSHSADLASIQMLVDLQDRLEAKQDRKEFYASLSRFQSDIPVITKQGKAGFQHKNGGGSTSYTYAKLEDISKAIAPYLSKHGLSYRYEQESNGNQITVHCLVTHEAGHQERTSMSGFADASGKKNPIQQIASTQSYLRRYTLTGALGITVADEDDDAQACATQAPQQAQTIGYNWDAFNNNLPTWTRALNDGAINRTQLIDKCNTRAKLSNEQVNIINQIIIKDEAPF
jgi:ERF superfamily